ncbi:DNRLRE domain-containing protein [Massilia sp. UMI-21]|nr:DNRLRE domain-containing protein [Massilia sp. UMI-21]
MKEQAQRGILLLPVTLTLAVVGALAYAMTRGGGMDLAAIDAEYDIERARYLAEAGLQLAKWQNERLGCKSQRGFGTVDLPGGRIVSGTMDEGGGQLAISLTATTATGAVNQVAGRRLRMHRVNDPTELAIKRSDIDDTFIREGYPGQGKGKYLETTDDQAHGLVEFHFPKELNDAVVLQADFRLTQVDSKSAQPARALALHRVTSDWKEDDATWTAPWSTAGGDYVARPAASTVIAGNAEYSWRIDALVEGWVNKTVPNYGILLKPTGLLEARFASHEENANQPQLLLRYLPRC